jgi:predicted nucleotidyltransferase
MIQPRLRPSEESTGGFTPPVSRAISMFADRVGAEYGTRLVSLVMFGSRARGQASRESDIDMAVVLDNIDDPTAERLRLSDISYDVLIETGEEVQAWPVPAHTWDNPGLARNPVLVRAMKRDGIRVSPDHDRGPFYKSR